MLAAVLIVCLVASTHCLPVDEQQPPLSIQKETPQKAPAQEPLQPIPPSNLPENNAQPEDRPQIPVVNPVPAIPEGGAPPPGDLAESPDVNPAQRPGTSDLDTDSTLWGGYGWGYRRPYYGWGGYSSPWRRWGWGGGYGWGGRGYGGYGGWGWGGRGWGGGWGGGYWG